jgi:pimeloyl-ACP methyl ester carboxylesterase
MLWLRHCTAALLAATTIQGVLARESAQPPAVSQAFEGTAEFTLFISGSRVGIERVRVARAGTAWVISSTALFGPPLNLTVNRFELKYTADWQPTELNVEATQTTTQGPRTLGLATSFGVTTAVNEITQNGTTNSKTDKVSARTIVLPNNFYAGYEALAARLGSAQPGAELPIYVAPQTEIKATVKAMVSEQLSTPSGPLPSRRYTVALHNPDGVIEALVTIDARARLVRLEIPSARVTLVRSDLATVATRSQPIRNETDTDVIIPANGFTLAGTMTVPPGMGRLKHPAVVLVTGSGQIERDETVAGIPIFAQLAGSLAKEGFVVVRYDKRGIGQSGGRSERATLQDYADDLTAVVKWLAKRKDIEPRRISVVGHSEGGAVALLAAREKKISALVLIAAPGTTGADLVLEQQRHLLDEMKAPEAERNAKIELQQRIHAAVISDKGWEAIPPELRTQAESTWFRSLLLFDPAKVIPKVKQPMLIIHGKLDKQVLPHHADTLAKLARARKKAGAVELVHLPDINHLLVPAETGEVSEYPVLKDKTVAPAVVKAIVEFLKKL